MVNDDIPDVFWDFLASLPMEGLTAEDGEDWRPALPAGVTHVLEVAESSLSYGRMVHIVGDPASTSVAYTHVILHHGLLGMRVYYPAQPVPGAIGIAAYLIGFRDLPEVREMYEVERVLRRLDAVSDARSAYGRAVSAATVSQATRALAGLAQVEKLPFTLLPLQAA
jgi:hypothetical protein